MKVHEIMTAHARCVGPDNTLVEAAGLMREMDVGVLPVCEDDRIVGMITDRDLAVRAIADGRDPNTTAVRDVMTPGAVYVFADQQVEEAARLMQEHEVRRLPVMSREKRLVGILSLGDLAVSSSPAFSGMTLREVSQPDEPNGRERKRDAMGRAAGAGSMTNRDSGESRNGRDSDSDTEATSARTSKRGTSTVGKSARSSSSGRTQSTRTKRKTSAPRSRKTTGAKSARGTTKRRKTTARSRG